jgi:hypothetical protein
MQQQQQQQSKMYTRGALQALLKITSVLTRAAASQGLYTRLKIAMILLIQNSKGSSKDFLNNDNN